MSAPRTEAGPVLTARFVLLGLTATLFGMAFGASLPVLPRYVHDSLGGGDVAVGVVVGSLSVGAIVARPFVGRLGDRHGRRVLIVGGAALAGLGMVGHAFADSVPVLVALRVLMGVGQAGVMVGTATLAMDVSPPSRWGEATSYVLVAFHIGLGTGPLLGEWLLNARSADAVWYASGVGMAASFAVALALPQGSRAARGSGRSPPRVRLVHPTAWRPGLVLGLGVLGVTGFHAFVPLFGEEIGVEDVAPVFLLSSATMILVRAFGARLPDRLGPSRGATFALVLMATGLFAMGSWREPVGLYLSTIVLATGSSLLFPSLVSAAVSGVADDERSSAMATFTVFLDISNGLGVVVFGAIAAGTSYGGAFLVGGGLTVGALVTLRAYVTPRLQPVTGAAAGVSGRTPM